MAAEADAVDAATVRRFLSGCIETLGSEETRRSLVRCTSIRPGEKLVEIQKRVWDDLGVPVGAGRRAVSAVSERFPEEAEALVELREAFSRAVDAAYLRCLQDRRPATLDRKGKLSRTTVLEFLDACHVTLDVPEVRERLRAAIRETGALPEAVLNEVHGEVMELLGVERGHGLQGFQQLGASQQFAQDREVATAFARWRGKNSSVCLRLLYEHRKAGGELKVDEEVEGRLLELRAKEGLDAMSMEQRQELLEKWAKKVNIFRRLPPPDRKRHLDRLSDQDRLELVQAEVLMSTLVELRERQAAGASE